MFYQALGYEQLKNRCNNGSKQEKMSLLIQELKQQGRFRDIERECEIFQKTYQEKEPDVPFDLAYCSDDVLLDYLHDNVHRPTPRSVKPGNYCQKHSDCRRAS